MAVRVAWVSTSTNLGNGEAAGGKAENEHTTQAEVITGISNTPIPEINFLALHNNMVTKSMPTSRYLENSSLTR